MWIIRWNDGKRSGYYQHERYCTQAEAEARAAALDKMTTHVTHEAVVEGRQTANAEARDWLAWLTGR